MKHLTTVLFRSRILGFVPGWLALILVLGGTAVAVPPVFNGSLAVPAGGSIKLTNATSTAWAPIDGDSKCFDSTSVNCVVGSIQQNVNYTGSNGSFPTGITGYGYMNGTGNQAFGVFGRCDLYQNGVCTNEFDSFNFSGADPSGTFPPDQSFGTTDHIATAFQVAAYGNNKSKVGVQIAPGTQTFLAGIYVNPNAVSTYGALIGAPTAGGTGLQVNAATTGTGVVVNGFNSASSLGLQVTGAYTGSGPTNFITFADHNNTNGINVLLGGNGATNPNKTIRVLNGAFQILNNAYSTAIFNMGDDGTTSLVNSLNLSAGDIQLTGGSSQNIKLTDASATPNKYLRASGGSFQVVDSAFTNVLFSITDAGAATIHSTATVVCSGCSNAGYISPSLTAAGATTSATQHSVYGVCSAGTTCTVSFTPAWSSATAYSCQGLAEASQASAPYISAKSASSITFTLGSSAAFDYACTGT